MFFFSYMKSFNSCTDAVGPWRYWKDIKQFGSTRCAKYLVMFLKRSGSLYIPLYAIILL